MTEAIPQSAATPPAADPRKQAAGWLHFGLASGILLLAILGWFTAIQTRLIFPIKRPVPWAAFETVEKGQTVLWRQEVSPDSRWINLATQLGPYRRLQADDLPNSRGKADGEIVYASEILSALAISGKYDEKQLAARAGNWYVSRLYLDTRKALAGGGFEGAYALWHLDVTFYTGSVDLVPHTPDNCLQAAGRQITGRKVVTFDVAVPDRWKKWWGGKVEFTRIDSESSRNKSRSVDYFVFCLNGRPETSRLAVRGTLTLPWVPYCYFAKIQFAPRTEADISDVQEADKAAEDFVRHFLPEVLKGMPTPDDVDKLKSAR